MANAFGSPNLLTSNHICTWNRRIGSKYTYGSAMPLPDFDNTRCMLIWGINPPATSPAQAMRINRARNRRAKLIVIDPRKTSLAAKADCWLRVHPGKDGELAMAMIHVMLEEELFDTDFARAWTNGTFLVRADNQHLLTEADIQTGGNPDAWMVRDDSGGLLAHNRAKKPALFGSYSVKLQEGSTVECRTVLEMLKEAVAQFAPERSETITTVPPEV